MVSLIQPSFAKGEISPALYGRVDTAAYQVAARSLLNMKVHKHGGASNREGLRFTGPVKAHSYAPRLIPFRFKTTDTYILEFGDRYMRVIRNDFHVLETAVAITNITVTAGVAVVTTGTAHGYSDAQEVYLSGVVGMTQINTRRFIVNVLTSTTFRLLDQVDSSAIDASGYGTYTSGGSVARIYTVEAPYAVGDLDTLKYVQSADVMTLTHPSYPVYELSRTAHAAWTFTAPTFAPSVSAPTGISATADTTGTVTVSYTVTAIDATTSEESLRGTDNAPKTIVGASQVNPVGLGIIGHGYSSDAEIYVSGVLGMTEINNRRFSITIVDADNIQLNGEDGTAYTGYAGGGTTRKTSAKITNSAATKDNTISWTPVTGASQYFIYRSTSGVFALIGTTTGVSFKDDNKSADASSTPPVDSNPFRLPGQYPGCAGYFEQRRVFGGSTDKPDTSNFSQTGNFSNFTRSQPGQAGDAITATLASQEVNEIRYFVPGNDLITFTSGAEFRINSGTDSAFSAESLKQKPQSSWGVGQQKPIVVGQTIIYTRDTSASIRSFGYSIQVDGYTGSDLTLLAGHLFGQVVNRTTIAIKDWSYAKDPDSIIYVVREDGKVVLLTFEQEQEIMAWTRAETNGHFERVAVIRPSSDDVDDAAYFVVKRIINGRTVRYIERTVSRRFASIKDAFFVDAGLTYDVPVSITGVSQTLGVVTVTAHGHGFSNGDEIDFSDIIWIADENSVGSHVQPEQLNGERWEIGNVTANTFDIVGLDGTDFNAYVENGTVRKAISAVSGLDHLEGAAVACLADGGVCENLVVTNGAITLPEPASRVHVGLPYVSDLQTLNIETQQGTIQGKQKRVAQVTVRFERSGPGVLVGPDEDGLTEFRLRQDESMGEPTELFTGDLRQAITNRWNEKGSILIRQKYPLPMTVLATIPELEVGNPG